MILPKNLLLVSIDNTPLSYEDIIRNQVTAVKSLVESYNSVTFDAAEIRVSELVNMPLKVRACKLFGLDIDLPADVSVLCVRRDWTFYWKSVGGLLPQENVITFSNGILTSVQCDVIGQVRTVGTEVYTLESEKPILVGTTVQALSRSKFILSVVVKQ